MEFSFLIMTLKPITMLCSCSLLINCNTSSSLPHPATAPTPMNNSTAMTVAHITLQAREERRPPAGEVPRPDRDIGFATLFYQFENHREADQAVTIDQVQIQDAHSGRIYMQTEAPQTLHLRPLEISANDVHLNNKTGFAGAGQVRAVITYTLAGRQETLTTAPVAYSRF
jgi:hypothetical protein